MRTEGRLPRRSKLDGCSVTTAHTIKEARLSAGLSASEAAALVGVTTVTWQRWEGQTARKTVMPDPIWQYFLLLVDRHPVYQIIERTNTCTSKPPISL